MDVAATERAPLTLRLASIVVGCLLATLLAECVLQVVVRTDLLPAGNDYVAFARRGVNTLPGSSSLYRYSVDRKLGVELVPGAMQDHIRINAHGGRGPEFAPERLAATLRVAVVGDSETFGAALAEEVTLPGALQHQIASLRSGCAVEVLNFGMPGYNLEQSLRVAVTRAAAAQPDLVIFYYVFNDPIEPGINRVEARSFRDRSALVLLAKWLYHSYIPTAYFYRGGERDARLVDFYLELHAGHPWHRVRTAIEGAAHALSQRGIGFVVAIAPELVGYQDFAGYPFMPIHDQLLSLEGEELQVVDTLSALRNSGRPPRSFWTSNIDPHKNADANARIAALLADALAARGLLGCAGRASPDHVNASPRSQVRGRHDRGQRGGPMAGRAMG